jgi:uncharacterized metal-binding protein YceD (DUF177 family)
MMVVLMGVVFDIVAIGHDEDAAVEPHHVNLGRVEPRQDRSADNLINSTECGVSLSEVEHAIQSAEQRIEFVRAEQHRDAEVPLQCARQFDDGPLVVKVETDQRFIEQQQTGTA